MSANAIVAWAFVVAVVVVLAMAAAQAMRALRELKRATARVEGYPELPLFASLERAESDAQRLGIAVEAIAPLIGRAEAAMAIIRRGPVPPELVTAGKRLVAEVRDLRSFASR